MVGPAASAAQGQHNPEVHAPKGFADAADCPRPEDAANLTGIYSDNDSDELPGLWILRRQQEQILGQLAKKGIIYTDGSAIDTGKPDHLDYYRSGTCTGSFQV